MNRHTTSTQRLVARSMRHSQRGAAVIMTAGFMLLGVLCLALVVDTGRLYMEKRSLQRIADVIALEVASRRGCVPDVNGVVQAQSLAAAALARLKGEGNAAAGITAPVVRCGVVNGNPRIFTSGGQDAVEVIVTHSVVTSLVAGGKIKGNTDLIGRAVAGTAGNPLARLTIRSQVAKLGPSSNPLVQAVVGGLLGIDNLDVVGWKGIAGTQINILDLIDTGKLGVGTFEELLTTDITLLQLIDASIDVVGVGSTAGVGLSALKGKIPMADVSAGLLDVNLGQLLGLKTGAPEAAADVTLDLLDLISSSIMLANKNDPNSVATIDIPDLNLLGLATAVVKVKVIESPRLSAVGNPSEIDRISAMSSNYDPSSDPGAIYVRTAQVRVFASVDIPALNGINSLVDLTGLTDGPILSGVASFLSGHFSLGNLVGAIVGSLVCPLVSACPRSNTAALKILPNARLDISLDLGGGEAWIADYKCSPGKELTIPVRTRVGGLRVGKLGETRELAMQNAFASDAPPSVVEPVPLLQLGSIWARPGACLLGLLCTNVQYNTKSSCEGGPGGIFDSTCNYSANEKKNGYVKPATSVVLGISAGVIGQKDSDNMIFPASGQTLPEVDCSQRPQEDCELTDAHYQATSVDSGIVGSLAGTLSGIGLKVYSSGGVLSLLSGVVNSLVPALSAVISSLLSPLLDPLVTFLLETLGLDLAQTEVAGQLTCGSSSGVGLLN